MLLTLEVLIVLAVIVFISYPLLWGRKGLPVGVEEDLSKELLSKKETLYTTLKDLDFDYATGKLTDEDYQLLREKFRYEATSLLKEIDKKTKGKMGLEDEIEKEIEAFRQRKVEKVEKPKKFCSNCGTPHQKGGKFCSNCGQTISLG